MKSAGAVGLAPIGAPQGGRNHSLGIGRIDRQRIKGGPGQRVAARGHGFRPPCRRSRAAIVGDDRPDPEIGAAGALARADIDPIGVGGIDGQRADRE